MLTRTSSLRRSKLLPLALLLLVGVSSVGAVEPEPPDHKPFDTLLRRYVSERGVDYAGWRETEKDRRALWEYVKRLEKVAVSDLEQAPGGRDEALAFWINLYNAATLRLVLGSYPIDSIKDLGGFFSSPWDRELVTVEGQALTLNDIENAIIRPKFEEPRIHFALNCAARSCPPLRAGAYFGNRLDAQLEEQTRAFLGDPKLNAIEGDRYRLSKIFDWYKDDFQKSGGSVQSFVRPYLVKEGGADPGEKAGVKHFDYDWALNDAAP